MYKWNVVFSIHESSAPNAPMGKQVGRSRVFEIVTQYDNPDYAEREARRLWIGEQQVFEKFPEFLDGMSLSDYPNIKRLSDSR